MPKDTTPIKDILKQFQNTLHPDPYKPSKPLTLDEAEQAIQTYIDNKIEEALNKQRGMQKITAYIPIEKGGLDED